MASISIVICALAASSLVCSMMLPPCDARDHALEVGDDREALVDRPRGRERMLELYCHASRPLSRNPRTIRSPAGDVGGAAAAAKRAVGFRNDERPRRASGRARGSRRDAPLRRDVRLVGDALGRVLVEQGGEGLLADVERVRRLARERASPARTRIARRSLASCG